jgi:topoisomerase-4 subunit B
MRDEPVVLDKKTKVETMLEFYMGKNDDDRRQFIMERLRDEIDEVGNALLNTNQ